MDADTIVALRGKLEWTQERLADYLGVDRSTVSRMESGQEPSGPVERLLRQLEAFGVDQDAPGSDSATSPSVLSNGTHEVESEDAA